MKARIKFSTEIINVYPYRVASDGTIIYRTYGIDVEEYRVDKLEFINKGTKL